MRQKTIIPTITNKSNRPQGKSKDVLRAKINRIFTRHMSGANRGINYLTIRWILKECSPSVMPLRMTRSNIIKKDFVLKHSVIEAMVLIR